jgi:hypothetical protein
MSKFIIKQPEGIRESDSGRTIDSEFIKKIAVISSV